MEILYDGNIIVHDNFLSKDECELIKKWMNDFDYNNLPNHDISFWHKRLIAEKTTTLIPGYESSFDLIKPLLNDIRARIVDLLNTYETDNWELSDINFTKMWKGSHPFPDRKNIDLEMFLHTDNQEENGYSKEVFWGCIIYPNDGYIGGELFYPKYKFKYKAKSGSIIFHRGNVRHGVLSMIDGMRYAMPLTIFKK